MTRQSTLNKPVRKNIYSDNEKLINQNTKVYDRLLQVQTKEIKLKDFYLFKRCSKMGIAIWHAH